MSTFTCVLASILCVHYGCRSPAPCTSSEKRQSLQTVDNDAPGLHSAIDRQVRSQGQIGVRHPAKTLAMLFLSLDPGAGWQCLHVGNMCGGVLNNPTVKNIAACFALVETNPVCRAVLSMELTDSEDAEPRSFPTGWDFWRQLGSPKTVCAPMVDQSECAFRMLCRELGTDLAYTPMIHARLFKESPVYYRGQHFDPHPSDRPLIAQLAGHDPDVVLESAKIITASGLVDAIDLNFGCPQGIARKGRYGAFLLDEPEVVVALVRKLASELSVPVTAKIRMLPSLPETIKLCKRIEEAGASILTIHGRTREQNKQFVGAANWDVIREVVRALDIPVIANGGVATLKDVHACMNYTGCAAVMSSEALLENPALFCSNIHPMTGAYLDQNTLAQRYLEYAFKHPPSKELAMIRGHLFKFLHTGWMQHPNLRDELLVAKSMEELKDIVSRLKAAGWDMPNFHHADPTRERLEFSWYQRHSEQGIEARHHTHQKQTAGLSREDMIARALEKRERKAHFKRQSRSTRFVRRNENKRKKREFEAQMGSDNDR